MSDEEFMARAPAAPSRRVMSDEEFAAAAPVASASPHALPSFMDMAQAQLDQGVASLREEPAAVRLAREGRGVLAGEEDWHRALLPLVAAPVAAAGAVEDTATAVGELGDPAHTVTHYRQLAQGLRNFGIDLPIDPPSPDAAQEYVEAALTALSTAGGGAAGQAIGAGAKAALKQLLRGFRSRPGAQQMIDQARHAGTLVEAGQPATTSLGRELAAGTAAGTAIVAPIDPLVPGDLPDWLEPILAGAAPGVQHVFRGSEALLVGNPKFRELAMSPSRGGRVSQVLGMAAGYLLAKNLTATQENVDSAMDWAIGGTERSTQ